MATIKKELVHAILNRAYGLNKDFNNQNNLEEQCEFLKQTVLAEKSLTKGEKSYAIKLINEDFDYYKIIYNKETKRICKDCQVECLATLYYCENCVRNYLKTKISNWTSGNNDIDNLIQKCQMETLKSDGIVEWIPYNNLQNIKYKLKAVSLRFTRQIGSMEGKSHLTISNKYGQIVLCYGITQDPSDGIYMLVMIKMHENLREYLQQNHSKLTWKDRIKIIYDIIPLVRIIYKENAIHRDLYSGNILFHQLNQIFYISDLGICGPANKSLNSVYENLPYIAPEVIAKKEYSFASDFHNIGMLMWEI
ncbi:kinase-like domain-containing protein [Glomus cerebriforme]|uniref:Kinase-like domain-containing protein n=1 Tax=Glomus cerebriforme TaxID=658196 RepID=A0A397SDL7_9GLOM|nr:kinase-like domain-containing protein [Glomus cerebriforme]